ncbi:nibrin-like isoform X2 [Physella acuta]|uniref:nibrin-like isoform X2 n=1 Tax=Physella acuta TaxID=109671 RepID=UPI0027DCB6FE|nr:nibrin-like isoform X2 [Physella acuta]
MWELISTSQLDLRFILVGDHNYVVGRQNCDINIQDASVSRRQAVLTMAHYESNVAKSFVTPTLTLEDVSKFGTFVNGKPVKTPGGSHITLKHNDEIKFGGSPASIFRAVYEPFIATTSCLEKAPKKCLHKVMSLLGGHIVREWRPTCDLLIMSNINVTIKVICAINNQKHIVTPQYLDDLYSYHRGEKEKPDPFKYLPEVVDQEVPQGVSFHPDIRRATLLEGLKFYFLSALQFNKTNLAVSTAGGQPILLEDGTEEDADAMTLAGTVVVAVTRDVLVTLSPACQKFVRLVYNTLKRKQLRMVTDPEIGWAILTCNTADFCNPKSPITPNMLSSMASQTLSQMTELDTSVAEVKSEKRSFSTSNQQLLEEAESPAKRLRMDDVPKRSNLVASPFSQYGENQKKPSSTVNSYITLAVKHEEPEPSTNNKLDDNPSDNREPSIASKQTGQAADPGSSCTENIVLVHSREPSPQREMSNIFGRRQQPKKTSKCKTSNWDDSDDDEIQTKKKTSKRKPIFLDDEDDEPQPCKKSTVGMDDSDGAEIQSKKTPSKHIFIIDDEDDQPHAGKQSTDDKDFDLPSKHSCAIQKNVMEKADEKVECFAEALDQPFTDADMSSAQGISCHGNIQADAKSSTISESGWLNVCTRKSESANNNDRDLKPDTELLRDKDGKLIQNLCEVKVVELLAHTVKYKNKPAPTSKTKGDERNFKKFQKNKNVGAGKLPTIIGGRDLEVYLGNKQKDFEDIFSNCLAIEKERQAEEKRTRELFDWDEKRKTVNKRIR